MTLEGKALEVYAWLSILTEEVNRIGWRKCVLVEKWVDKPPVIQRIYTGQTSNGFTAATLQTFCHKSRRRIMEYRPQSYHDVENLISIKVKSIVKVGADAQKYWLHTWTRAQQMLLASGLWPEVMMDITIGLDIGWDKIQAAKKVNDLDDPKLSYDQNQKAQLAAVAAISPKITETWHLWHMGYPAKIKTIYFGKYVNKEYLAKIAEALQTKTACNEHRAAGYDVGFEYNPVEHKAWWKEEFRGCGNGHYYLALNGTHALHYEDD